MGSRVHIMTEEGRRRLAKSRNKFPSRPGGGGTSVLLAPGIPSVPVGPPVKPEDQIIYASVNIDEPIDLAPGVEKAVALAYTIGYPAARGWRLRWYATLDGVIDLDTAYQLTDALFLPVVEFLPEAPEGEMSDNLRREIDSNPNAYTDDEIARAVAGRAQEGTVRFTGHSDGRFWYNGNPQDHAYGLIEILQPGVNLDV